jgi:hypothetical protein
MYKIIQKKGKTKVISSEKQRLLDNLKEAFIQVKLYQEGKIKLKTAQEFFKEIRENQKKGFRLKYPK